jgi:hypothetical protein
MQAYKSIGLLPLYGLKSPFDPRLEGKFIYKSIKSLFDPHLEGNLLYMA